MPMKTQVNIFLIRRKNRTESIFLTIIFSAIAESNAPSPDKKHDKNPPEEWYDADLSEDDKQGSRRLVREDIKFDDILDVKMVSD